MSCEIDVYFKPSNWPLVFRSCTYSKKTKNNNPHVVLLLLKYCPSLNNQNLEEAGHMYKAIEADRLTEMKITGSE